MILLIDNYDSFVYNLYQFIASTGADVAIARNDQLTLEDIDRALPDAAVLSPGPGKPSDAGICVDLVRHLKGRIPILGICLGHQAIAEAFGGTVTYARQLLHGKTSFLDQVGESPIFHGIRAPIQVARYHSLAVSEETLPPELVVTARDRDGTVMAMEHQSFPIYGLQFHPESIMTPKGMDMIQNFISQTKQHTRRHTL